MHVLPTRGCCYPGHLLLLPLQCVMLCSSCCNQYNILVQLGPSEGYLHSS
jgi:hypothetical protein